MSKRVVATNGYEDLIVDLDSLGGYIELRTYGKPPTKFYLDPDEIDDVVLALLKVEKKLRG